MLQTAFGASCMKKKKLFFARNYLLNPRPPIFDVPHLVKSSGRGMHKRKKIVDVNVKNLKKKKKKGSKSYIKKWNQLNFFLYQGFVSFRFFV